MKSKDSSSEDEEDVRCLYCSHLFSESTKAGFSALWAHSSCAGVEDDDDDDDEDVRFVCERCVVVSVVEFLFCTYVAIGPFCLHAWFILPSRVGRMDQTKGFGNRPISSISVI